MTIELVALSSERARMQAAVDAAALAGARETAAVGSGARDAKALAESFATSQVSDLSKRIAMTFTASQSSDGTFQVSGVGRRGSFFGNLVPPGGFKIDVNAVAEVLNEAPLCILVLQKGGNSDGLTADQNSNVEADNCLVHSNGNMKTQDRAKISAGTIQTTLVATGTGYSPAVNNGALGLNDPFYSREIKRPAACSGGVRKVFRVDGNSKQQLAAGTHEDVIEVTGNAVLTLLPGEHFFCRDINIGGNGTLIGDDVVILMDDNNLVRAKQNSSISLTGRRTGIWAGFVLVATRNNTTEMQISSSKVDKLLGTIYLPEATLLIDAPGSVAEGSKWSVVVAKKIILDKSASLVINTGYAGSGVPVPGGVGNQNNGPPRLRQ